jgi:hypothetical protein
MAMIPALAHDLQGTFIGSKSGRERWHWFMLTLQAIIVPITVSRTSNLLRSIALLFGVEIEQWRFYTFMASVKLPWEALWHKLWRLIPQPLTDGRLLAVLDDSINAKTGRHIFACQRSFDHAAKPNQTRWPWAQTIVTVGLLRRIHGRWACIPLAFAFYLRQATLSNRCIRVRGQALCFEDKFAQAVRLLKSVAAVFVDASILVIADSWFGNRGLAVPLRAALGARVHLLSRLRVNAALYDLAPTPPPGTRGRPRKYGARLGNAAALAEAMRANAKPYTLHVYSGQREVLAAERVVMLKTLRCPVRVVWVYRRRQWLALMTTDLTLSVAQIVEFYSARWKIESGFREIKQEIGSAHTQTRNPDAVTNHLNFCMFATAVVWLYAIYLPQAPARRYRSKNTTEYTFADVRRELSHFIAKGGFGIDCANRTKPPRNRLISIVMGLVA